MIFPSRPRRRKSSSRWVVEIGAAHVAAGRFETRGAGTELETLAHEAVAIGDATDEMDLSALEAALFKLVSDAGVRGEVLLVIPGHLALTKLVRVPAAAEAQRAKLIEFEVRQAIPFDLSQVYWAHRELGVRDGELEVMVVASKSSGVDGMLAIARSAGLEVTSVVTAGPTLLNTAADDEPTRAVISIGARATHLVWQAGARSHLRTLTLAGNAISADISRRLDQPLAEADSLKIGMLSGAITLPGDTPAGAAVQAATAAFVARLRLEFNRTLVTQVRPAQISLAPTIELAGGGAQVPGLIDALESTAAVKVTSWQMPSQLNISDSARGVIERAGAERFADLVGAFAGIGATGEVALDLAPPGIRGARAAKQRRPRWLIAAVLLVASSFLPGVHYLRLAAARSEAAEVLRQQVVPVQVLRDRTIDHLAELDRLRVAAQFWAERTPSKDAWESLLADLQTSLTGTGDVWLERMQVIPQEPSGSASELERARLQLRISGRLLDRENPLSRVSQNAYERVTALLERFLESPQISGIEGERFDASDPGILRFDFTLVVNPQSGL
jgi:type IV pilus assembly protein PilM